MKTHATWIFAAFIMALAVEGWQAVAGETVAHSIGLDKSLIGVGVAAIIGYLYSLFYDSTPPKPAPKKRPRAKSH
jgi:hypothetical protein